MTNYQLTDLPTRLSRPAPRMNRACIVEETRVQVYSPSPLEYDDDDFTLVEAPLFFSPSLP